MNGTLGVDDPGGDPLPREEVLDPLADPRWEELPQYGEGLYRRVLAEYYMCSASRLPLKVRQILGRVSTGAEEFEY